MVIECAIIDCYGLCYCLFPGDKVKDVYFRYKYKLKGIII